MHQQKSHLQEFLVKYFNNKELDDLYISVFLKTLAESLISIFIPIYLLTLNYTLIDISVYFLILSTTLAVIMPLTMNLNHILGVKKTIALGTFVSIIYYYLLNYLGKGISYPLLAFISGVSIAIYFSGFHIEFTRSVIKKQEASELSILNIVLLIPSILGPLIGAILISKTSFNFLFILAAIILFISVIPLILKEDFKEEVKKIPFKKFINIDSKRKAIVYQSEGMLNLVSGIFWPIFIYLTLKNLVSLGAIVSITSLFMIFIILYLGRLSDKNDKKVLKTATLFNAPFWIIRLFLLSPIGFFFSNLLSSITSSAIFLSFYKTIYEKARKSKDVIHYFLFREYNLAIGRTLFLIFAILTNSIFWMFIVCFFITFSYLLLLREMK